MNEITRKAWTVFRSAFKDGDDVIVEDEKGNFFRGKLTAHNECVVLTRAHGNSIFIDWDQIEFMAHDGFPVKELMKMTPEEAEKRARQSNKKIIRDILDRQKLGSIVRTVETTKPNVHRSRSSFGGGCPFIVESVRCVAVYNRGNTGRRFWYSNAAEVLTFQSDDGAWMHNYDSDHLFMV